MQQVPCEPPEQSKEEIPHGGEPKELGNGFRETGGAKLASGQVDTPPPTKFSASAEAEFEKYRRGTAKPEKATSSDPQGPIIRAGQTQDGGNRKIRSGSTTSSG